MVLGAEHIENRRKNSTEREVEELMGEEIFNDPVKPVHKGKKMTLSAQIVKVEKSYYLCKTVKDYFINNDLRLAVVEKLKNLKLNTKEKNITKEFRKTLSNWNYRELLRIIQMRCEENRVFFRSVNPFKTSQKCPKTDCAHTQRENRNGEEFKCLKCGESENLRASFQPEKF